MGDAKFARQIKMETINARKIFCWNQKGFVEKGFSNLDLSKQVSLIGRLETFFGYIRVFFLMNRFLNGVLS